MLKSFYSKLNNWASQNYISKADSEDTIKFWQAKFYASIMVLLIPLSFILYPPSLFMCIISDMYFLAIADTLAFLTMQFLFFYTKLSLRTSISIFLATLYILGLILVFTMGWSGPGLIYLISISIFSAIIHSKKAGYLTFTGNLLLFFFLYIAVGFDLFKHEFFDNMSLASVFSISLNFIIMNLLAVTAINSLTKGLKSKIKSEKILRNELEAASLLHIEARRTSEESENFIKLLLDTLPIPFYYKDKDGRFVGFNKSFEAFLSLSYDDIWGKSNIDIYTKDNAEFFSNKENELFRDPMFQSFETELTAGNKAKTIIINQISLQNVSNEIIGLIGTIYDITEIRNAERRIRDYNENLEIKVAERTIELKSALAEIESANKELKILNQTKDRFFSIIAHDLKNPLGATRNMLETFSLYYDKMNSSEIDKLLSSLHKSTDYTIAMLDNLIQWSNLQTNNIELNIVTTSLADSVEHCIEQTKPQSLIKQIEIVNKVSFAAVAEYDSKSIYFVIKNLLTNAIKFSHSGAKITIGSIAEEKSTAIFIKDEGIGMARELLSNLFKIDFSSGRSGTNGEKGTGLGLIICKELLEKQGGKLWAESIEGKGSTFYFSLPCQKSLIF